MKSKMAKLLVKQPKFWIDGTIYNICKTENAKRFKTESVDGRISTTFHLPLLYYDKIYNNTEFTLASLKKSESIEIVLPKRGSAGNVTISGDTFEEVIDAREEFHSMVNLIRKKIPPRQFIAVPTLSEEIKKNFNKFKQELLARNGENAVQNLEESVFQKNKKLHITVCVCALLDDVEVDEAKRLLEEVKHQVLLTFFNKRNNLKIKLKGIEAMNTNLRKVNILFTKASIVDETDDFNLQIIANKIADFFYEKGFMKEMTENVKIHVTLINTKYRNTRTSANEPRAKKRWPQRIPIDAKQIIEEYKDFEFGTCNFDSVHLSLMSDNGANVGSSSILLGEGQTGFYTPLSIIKLTP